MYFLDAVRIEATMTRKARRNAVRADRLTRYVQKVYPYARITANLLQEYDHDLARIEKGSDRELYLKLAEADLRAEFEEDIKGLTMTQGRILVKLIDRETGHTSYDLVKQLRGSFQAWVWQGVAACRVRLQRVWWPRPGRCCWSITPVWSAPSGRWAGRGPEQ